MTTVTIPDWAELGAKAYVLRFHFVAGFGSYLTAHQVRIITTTPTLVRAAGVGTDGAVVTFRSKGDDLTASGSAVNDHFGRDDILVAAHDPRVAACRRANQIMTVGVTAARIDSHLPALRIKETDAANMSYDTVDKTIDALDAIIEAAKEARLRLLRVQNGV
jgi:hypothetical protein